MTESKSQNVVVLLQLKPGDRILIEYGIRIAAMFNKELCLCFNYRVNSKSETENIRARLTTYLLQIRSGITEIQTTTLLTYEPICKLASVLADKYEGIFIIVPARNYPRYADTLHRSPVPFLFVNDENAVVPEFKNLILAVDQRKQNSETAIWSSYFGRFNHAKIDLLISNQTKKTIKKHVDINIAFFRTLFQKLNIQYEILRAQKTGIDIGLEALYFALENKYDLFITLGSELTNPLEIIFGLPEKKIIKNAGNLPVLIINPRKDSYVLCD